MLTAANVGLSLPVTVASCAYVLAQLGEASDALCRLREAEQLVDREAARGIRRGWDRCLLGRTCLLLGQFDEAQRIANLAVEFLPAQPAAAAHAVHLLGDIAAHPDQFDAASAEAHYLKALTLAEPRGMRPLVAHCQLGLGKLYRVTGKCRQGREHLANATATYREMDMRFWLQQAELEMRQLG